MPFSTASRQKHLGSILVLLSLMIFLSACQLNPEATPFPTESPVNATPIQALLQTRALTTAETEDEIVEATATPSGESEAMVTEAAPSPTPSPGPTATPTPLPEPTLYLIQSGDTLIGIAEQFNLSADALVFANGYTSIGEITLVIGNELQIPNCEAHLVMPGNTLASIAQLCGITLDELIIANIERLASIGSLENVPLGFILYIPEPTIPRPEIDCNAQPARAQVIEYRPETGEGPFCLSQKFAVSTAAIIQGNVERLTAGERYGDVSLLIPSRDGALYRIGPDDIRNSVTIEDLANWYDVEPEAITDWNGNLVTDPLREGQQLFIEGANLSFGIFRAQTEDSESSQ